MLTISPVGGLCNRLYALHSAIHLADATLQDLRLLWQRDDKFGAHFHDLFEPIPSVKAYVDKNRLRRGALGTLIENTRLSTYRPKVLCDLRWDQVIALEKDDFDFLRATLRQETGAYRHFHCSSLQMHHSMISGPCLDSQRRHVKY